ncbi:hypothetical protein WSK_4299 [Novosphingobium sp. Rr 2-17]|uniref:hypothetical protein n=1 Tax=Novosphingobium sp. Rr 2-17 TaxID=555793 RepID=UPI0002697BF6|nr:hypothetical protein [Novosphingobium sp. Rr 2-17]EIZ77160.1 hypothetical protein WSK_4299 [Novosphingobium sp. Rr 2-17]
MERFHPLAADADISPEDLALTQAECALALGRLDGLLVGLSASEERLFCAGLLRAVLLSALAQAGFADAELRFNAWFAGIDRAPQETPLTPCSAYAVVRALLGEFGLHPWEPLAEAARTIALAARFSADRPMQAEDADTGEAIVRATELTSQAGISSDTALPFSGLARLHALLHQDPLFAPVERGLRTFSLGGRDVTIEQAAPRTPLWAVDAVLGRVMTECGAWQLSLPCPGAITAEALQPHLWPGEGAMVAARSLQGSLARLAGLIKDARARAALMDAHLRHLRSSARAPQVWTVLAGFAPLGLDQMTSAFGVSRRGTYAVGDALISAGLARREIVKGKVLLAAEEPIPSRLSPSLDQAPALSRPALAEFDAAMAEIDRLLVRSSGQI